jgi:hypothetical protein
MIIFDNVRLSFRVVDEDYQLTAGQQAVEREQVRPRILAELDAHGFASLRDDSHQCCKQEAHE